MATLTLSLDRGEVIEKGSRNFFPSPRREELSLLPLFSLLAAVPQISITILPLVSSK
jgi:hypothetical protein